ncbi:MAG: hypothetical protein ACI9VS_004514 [Candidatus Binatia bacterium]|jgi:hypothetical protein
MGKQAAMKRLLAPFVLISSIILLGGCATPPPSSGSGSAPVASDERLAEIQKAIQEQNKQIAELRAAMKNQGESFKGEMADINESLDTHLELLELFHLQINQNTPAAAGASEAAPPVSSIFGTATISQRRGDPLILKRMDVHLISDDAITSWNTLSQPRTFFNTPIKNADMILTALEFQRDLETPRAAESLDSSQQVQALNSHLVAFEKLLQGLTARPSTSSRVNGKYFFSNVPAGHYYLYARISPETYSVAWMIPIKIEGGGATEINFDSKNAKVFLNDLSAQ